jgi:hypothetical protein
MNEAVHVLGALRPLLIAKKGKTKEKFDFPTMIADSRAEPNHMHRKPRSKKD